MKNNNLLLSFRPGKSVESKDCRKICGKDVPFILCHSMHRLLISRNRTTVYFLQRKVLSIFS